MLPLHNSPVARRVVLTIILILWSISASAQHEGKPPLHSKLLSIHIKGLNHFKEDQVVAVSGLKTGQMTDEDDFKQALQRLGSTGLFTKLSYAYRYSTSGCDLDIQVSENEKLLPIVFDNFVWFSDDELMALLRSRVPLFNGQLPEAGDLADEVSDALDAVLAQHKVQGKADYLRFAPVNGPIDSYVYKINFHPVIIRDVSFPGAAAEQVAALRTAAQSLSGQEYLRTKIRSQEEFTFLPIYLSRGYLKAKFDHAEAKIATDGPRTLVDVMLPVHPGTQYKVTGLGWSGNSVFPADKLEALIHVKPGQPANAVQLDNDLENVKQLYGTKGYLNARVAPDPVMDDTQATVRYQLRVTEGDLYRMGDLQIDGVDEAAIRRINDQWQMKKGDAYDNTYPARFFQLIYRDNTLSRSYSIARKESVNPQDKTVTLALHFVPK